MKVKLNKPTTHKGKNYDKGDTLTVNARLGGAWIQTGKADVYSKKTVRTPKREQVSDSGGKDTSTEKHSE